MPTPQTRPPLPVGRTCTRAQPLVADVAVGVTVVVLIVGVVDVEAVDGAVVDVEAVDDAVVDGAADEVAPSSKRGTRNSTHGSR